MRSIDYTALAAIVMPNIGYLTVDKVFTTAERVNFNVYSQPPWLSETKDKINCLILMLANFLQGYASYIVWQEGGTVIPLSAFAFQVALFWVHRAVSLGVHVRSIEMSFYLIILTVIFALVAIVLFSQISSLAGLLMGSYLACLAHECARDYWRSARRRLLLDTFFHAAEETSRTVNIIEPQKPKGLGGTRVTRRPTGYPDAKKIRGVVAKVVEESSSGKLVPKDTSSPVKDTPKQTNKISEKHPTKTVAMNEFNEASNSTQPEDQTGENVKTEKGEANSSHAGDSQSKS